MSSVQTRPSDSQTASDVFVPKDAYLSREFARREAQQLWPKVWQVACREEEIPDVGDFVTYEILDDSITVVRTAPDVIKAYHNVCPHRGRRLTEGCGRIGGFVCRYHGWKWNLEGQNTGVIDAQDWGDTLDTADIALKGVQVDTWGGFVFINMDPEAEPLDRFLNPVNALCEKFEFEKLRYRWYRTVIFPANWKVVLEGFNEAYHVQQTHRQFLEYIEDYSNSAAYGKHGAFWYPPVASGKSRFMRSSRLEGEGHTDFRKYALAYYEEMHTELGAMITPRAYEAAQRLLDEADADAPADLVLGKLRALVRDAAIEDGAGWPDDLTPEIIGASRQDWHVFPNLIYLHTAIDGVLAYRARPNGDDPDTCIFDVWSLVRYAPGKAPPLKREFYNDWREADWGRVLTQDFNNLADVQKGMKSRAFTGSRTNPVQERAVSNFHETLWRLVQDKPAVADD